MQTSLALLDAPQMESWPKDSNGRLVPDKFNRLPFTHAALNGLVGLSQEAKDRVLEKTRLAGLAERYELDKVTRWKPKRVRGFLSPPRLTLLRERKIYFTCKRLTPRRRAICKPLAWRLSSPPRCMPLSELLRSNAAARLPIELRRAGSSHRSVSPSPSTNDSSRVKIAVCNLYHKIYKCSSYPAVYLPSFLPLNPPSPPLRTFPPQRPFTG